MFTKTQTQMYFIIPVDIPKHDSICLIIEVVRVTHPTIKDANPQHSILLLLIDTSPFSATPLYCHLKTLWNYIACYNEKSNHNHKKIPKTLIII